MLNTKAFDDLVARIGQAIEQSSKSVRARAFERGPSCLTAQNPRRPIAVREPHYRAPLWCVESSFCPRAGRAINYNTMFLLKLLQWHTMC